MVNKKRINVSFLKKKVIIKKISYNRILLMEHKIYNHIFIKVRDFNALRYKVYKYLEIYIKNSLYSLGNIYFYYKGSVYRNKKNRLSSDNKKLIYGKIFQYKYICNERKILIFNVGKKSWTGNYRIMRRRW